MIIDTLAAVALAVAAGLIAALLVIGVAWHAVTKRSGILQLCAVILCGTILWGRLSGKF